MEYSQPVHPQPSSHPTLAPPPNPPPLPNLRANSVDLCYAADSESDGDEIYDEPQYNSQPHVRRGCISLCADKSLALVASCFPRLHRLHISSAFYIRKACSARLEALRELEFGGFYGGPLSRVAPACTRLVWSGDAPIDVVGYDDRILQCAYQSATSLRELVLPQPRDGPVTGAFDTRGFAFMQKLPGLEALIELWGVPFKADEFKDWGATQPQLHLVDSWCFHWGHLRSLKLRGNTESGVHLDLALPLLAARLGGVLRRLEIRHCEVVPRGRGDDGPCADSVWGGARVLGCLQEFSVLEELSIGLSSSLCASLETKGRAAGAPVRPGAGLEGFLQPLESCRGPLRRVVVTLPARRVPEEVPVVSWDRCMRLMERHHPVLVIES